MSRTALFIFLAACVAGSSAASDEDYQKALDLLGLSKDDVAAIQNAKTRRADQSGPSIDTEGTKLCFFLCVSGQQCVFF